MLKLFMKFVIVIEDQEFGADDVSSNKMSLATMELSLMKNNVLQKFLDYSRLVEVIGMWCVKQARYASLIIHLLI